MKKPYMHTIVGSSGRNFVLIILFQLQGSKSGLFESNLFWVVDADVISFSFFVESKGKKI